MRKKKPSAWTRFADALEAASMIFKSWPDTSDYYQARDDAIRSALEEVVKAARAVDAPFKKAPSKKKRKSRR